LVYSIAMLIRIEHAAIEQWPLMERLMQLYMYDFSEIEGGDTDEKGRYHYQYLDLYWEDKNRHPFLIYVDDKPAGFVLIRKTSFLHKPVEGHTIAEFFVMRKYRHRGVGTTVASRIFDKFPGRWEVSETKRNTAAREFWRRVIGQYTGGKFEEVMLDNDKWRGPAQYFEKNG